MFWISFIAGVIVGIVLTVGAIFFLAKGHRDSGNNI